MNTVAQRDRTSGLVWYYCHIQPDGAYPCPTSRLGMIQSVRHKAPKLAYCSYEVIDKAREGQKTPIYVNHPLLIIF